MCHQVREEVEAVKWAAPTTLKDLDHYAFTWYQGLGLESVLTYKEVFLLDMLQVDVRLLLLDRWYGRRQVRMKSRLVRMAREMLMAWYPLGLFALERSRLRANHEWSSVKSHGPDGAILFVVEGGSESILGTLLPVIRSVQANAGYRPIVVTGDATAAARLAEERIPFLSLYEFPGDVVRHAWMARTALREFHRIATSQGHDPSRSFLGEMKQLGIFEVLSWRVMFLQQIIDATEDLLRGSVKGIVTASGVHPIGKTVLTLANRVGVPTVLLQDGFYGEGPDALTIGFLPISAQTVCVWGPGFEKILLRYGVGPNRIRITGQPRFDRIVALTGYDSRSEICNVLAIPDKAPLLVFASQNIFRREEQHRALLQSFADVLASIPEARLVVKLHPAEHPFLWNRAQAALGLQRLRIVKDIDLYRLLAASDVVMTVFSTVALEALLLGKPLVILTHLERSSEMRFVEFGAALPTDGQGLVSVVRAALFDRQVRENLARGAAAFVWHYASGMDGKATERVVDVIYAALQARVVPSGE